MRGGCVFFSFCLRLAGLACIGYYRGDPQCKLEMLILTLAPLFSRLMHHKGYVHLGAAYHLNDPVLVQLGIETDCAPGLLCDSYACYATALVRPEKAWKDLCRQMSLIEISRSPRYHATSTYLNQD